MTRERLLVGGNYAGSGSSSTYVTLGRLPDWPAVPAARVLTCSHPALPSALSKPLYGAVERHGRRSGALAGTFTPEPASSEIVISIPFVLPSSSSVRVPGLTAEFAEVVLRGFQQLAPSPLLAQLGGGRLDIGPAWWHEIDSGQYGFRDLAAKLVGVLSMPVDASGEDVWNCWRVQDDALELAPMLTWLSTTHVRWPEAALFRPGASSAALATLEARLGFPLPELVRRLLLCVDGGGFADDDTTRANRDECPRHRLLSVEQIAPAYFALAAAQYPHSDVPLSTPEHPLFRPGDGGMLVPWPFLPVAEDLDSDSLIVLEVLPTPYSNRIQLAAPQTAWPEWPVLHRRFVDFVADFVEAGSRRLIASRPGPEDQ